MATRKFFGPLLLIVFSLLLCSIHAQTSTPVLSSLPHVIKYSGTVKDSPSATVGMTFAIYDKQDGAAPMWLETQSVVTDESGHYNVILGSTKAEGLPASIFASGEARWIGVQAEGQAEQSRTLLVSVPYALKAGDADTLGGKPLSAFLMAADPTSTKAKHLGESSSAAPEKTAAVDNGPGGTTNLVPKWLNPTTLTNSAITESGGLVGIGVSNPAATLSLGSTVGEKFDFYQSPDSAVRLGIGIDQVNAGRELNLFTSSNTLNGAGRITLGYRREDTGGYVGNFTLLNSGNVGIGVANPAATLSLGSTVGEKFDFYQSPDSAVRLGIGIDQVNAGRELNLFTSSNTLNGAGRITLGYRREDNGAFVGTLTLLNSGNLGVGVSNPAATLSLGPTVGEKFDFYQSPDSSVRLGIGIDQVNAGRELNLFTSSNTLNGAGRLTLGYRREDTGTFVGNMTVLNSGNVGIGTPSPTTTLDVIGIARATGGFKFADASIQTTAVPGNCAATQIPKWSGTAWACAADATSGGGGGVFDGSSSQNTAIVTVNQHGTGNLNPDALTAVPPAAVSGFADSTTGFTAGVIGKSTSPNGLGVLGIVTGGPSQDNATAIVGIATSTTGKAKGVSGQSSSPNGVGGEFSNDNNSGVALRASVGPNTGAAITSLEVSGSGISLNASTISIQGAGAPNANIQMGGAVTVIGALNAQSGITTSSISTPTISGHTVQGGLAVTGNLSKASGSFKIDHPLDPAGKYLYHSFVESPDMMNIYNGVVTLDAKGQAWITMPDWFEALNMDFRYQLTSIGRFAPVFIAKEMNGNRFKISGGKAHGKVSWQVTGIRHDAYAEAHRIQVEEVKSAAEQGSYLHPELFAIRDSRVAKK